MGGERKEKTKEQVCVLRFKILTAVRSVKEAREGKKEKEGRGCDCNGSDSVLS